MNSVVDSVKFSGNRFWDSPSGALVQAEWNQEPVAVALGMPLVDWRSGFFGSARMGSHNCELMAAVKALQQGDMSFSLEDGASFGSGVDFTMGMVLPTADRRMGSYVPARVWSGWTSGVLCLSCGYCNVG